MEAILSQLGGATGELVAEQALQDVREAFALTTNNLEQIQLHLLGEMITGLKDTHAGTVKMLRSFVHKRATDNVSGDFYALDLGGTNFRVLKVTLSKGKVMNTESKQFKIPMKFMQGTADGLFGFIASSVATIVPKEAEDALGFTFSFPVQQIRLDAGKLIAWTKGFTTTGVAGKDVVQLLQGAFNKAGLRLSIVALVNDTVGTLITEYFRDNSATVGVILGTGMNACYWEKTRNIPKHLQAIGPDAAAAVPANDEMVINMEVGNFDSRPVPRALKQTPFDRLVDTQSPNQGKQYLEKMTSGMYLGEICRVVFMFLHHKGALNAVPGLDQKGAFETWQMSHCLEDKSADFTGVQKHFVDKYKANLSLEDRRAVREVCEAVAKRSARLAAAAVVAVVTKTGKAENCTISIDGSVFEKVPGYKGWMHQAIDELYAGEPHDIRLLLTKEGSGVGASLIAALAGAK